jgi:hypothetical protein
LTATAARRAPDAHRDRDHPALDPGIRVDDRMITIMEAGAVAP